MCKLFLNFPDNHLLELYNAHQEGIHAQGNLSKKIAGHYALEGKTSQLQTEVSPRKIACEIS